jgi:hypothetical protein
MVADDRPLHLNQSTQKPFKHPNRPTVLERAGTVLAARVLTCCPPYGGKHDQPARSAHQRAGYTFDTQCHKPGTPPQKPERTP